jgi:hypothetical protein
MAALARLRNWRNTIMFLKPAHISVRSAFGHLANGNAEPFDVRFRAERTSVPDGKSVAQLRASHRRRGAIAIVTNVR